MSGIRGSALQPRNVYIFFIKKFARACIYQKKVVTLRTILDSYAEK